MRRFIVRLKVWAGLEFWEFLYVSGRSLYLWSMEVSQVIYKVRQWLVICGILGGTKNI